MIVVRVTRHAAERYLERVNPRLTMAEAIEALSGPIIVKAAEFGAPYVKLGTGQHVVLEGSAVVTVLPRDQDVRAFDPAIDRRLGKARPTSHSCSGESK